MIRYLFILLPFIASGQSFVSYSAAAVDGLYCPTVGTPCGEATTILYSGVTYNIVEIGDRCWFAENLNYGTRINGGVTQTDNHTKEKWCYNDSEDSCTVYGGLYQWNEMMNYVTTDSAQGICPSGWHIPGYAEWNTLINCVSLYSSASGGLLKEAGLTHWNTPNTGASDTYGFAALPGGAYVSGFGDEGNYGYIWSSTFNPASSTYGYPFVFAYNNIGISTGPYLKANAYSVRCIKDL